MKFKVAVIGILAAILATNIIGTVITTSEAKAQTEMKMSSIMA